VTCPWITLASIDRIVREVQLCMDKLEVHDPLRPLLYKEFIGVLVRVALQRYPTAKSPVESVSRLFASVLAAPHITSGGVPFTLVSPVFEPIVRVFDDSLQTLFAKHCTSVGYKDDVMHLRSYVKLLTTAGIIQQEAPPPPPPPVIVPVTSVFKEEEALLNTLQSLKDNHKSSKAGQPNAPKKSAGKREAAKEGTVKDVAGKSKAGSVINTARNTQSSSEATVHTPISLDSARFTEEPPQLVDLPPPPPPKPRFLLKDFLRLYRELLVDPEAPAILKEDGDLLYREMLYPEFIELLVNTGCACFLDAPSDITDQQLVEKLFGVLCLGEPRDFPAPPPPPPIEPMSSSPVDHVIPPPST